MKLYEFQTNHKSLGGRTNVRPKNLHYGLSNQYDKISMKVFKSFRLKWIKKFSIHETTIIYSHLMRDFEIYHSVDLLEYVRSHPVEANSSVNRFYSE